LPTKIRIINSTWPPHDGEYINELVLNYDNWNDYGYRTSFGMYYYDINEKVHEVGFLKIYFWRNDEERTDDYINHTKETLGDTIINLDENYCSLGQDLSYYRNLKDLLPEEYADVLRRLNDMAISLEIKERFINEKGVQSSLLRSSGAEKALKEANELINDVQQEKNISFTYRVGVPYDVLLVDLTFDFEKTEYLPYRINILIGKNGTGKTQILSRLADSLSGYTDKREQNPFVGGRPPIDKVMSISYSAFDQFRKPPESGTTNRSFSYVYCGIQSEQGTLSIPQLRDNFRIAYGAIRERGRDAIWQGVLSELMELEHQRIIELIIGGRLDEVNWSSGQHILICTITELIAKIENESIILFDEPEIHLHPNAIANFMRMFGRLLEEYNSYAIFSTHSPIILQEIPSKYIQILDREEDVLTVRRPGIECFGSNISDIISDVFDVSVRESNYKSHLKELSKIMGYDEILRSFNNNLSLNALIFLKNCYPEEDMR